MSDFKQMVIIEESQKCFHQRRIIQNGKYIDVRCGYCYKCLSADRDEWTFRLKQEVKYSQNAYFITLTYAEENVPIRCIDTGETIIGVKEYMEGNLLNTETELQGIPTMYARTIKWEHWQDFMRRLRKQTKKKNLKAYVVSEYGEASTTELKYRKPHFHAALFNATEEEIQKAWKIKNDTGQIVSQGFADIKDLKKKDKTGGIAYIVGYTKKKISNMPYYQHITTEQYRQYQESTHDYSMNRRQYHQFVNPLEIPKRVISNGIGIEFLTPELTDYIYHNNQLEIIVDDETRVIPKYYVEKILEEHEEVGPDKNGNIKFIKTRDKRKAEKLYTKLYSKIKMKNAVHINSLDELKTYEEKCKEKDILKYNKLKSAIENDTKNRKLH